MPWVFSTVEYSIKTSKGERRSGEGQRFRLRGQLSQIIVLLIATLTSTIAARAQSNSPAFSRTYNFASSIEAVCCSQDFQTGIYDYGFTEVVNDPTISGKIQISSVSITANISVFDTPDGGHITFHWAIFVGPSALNLPVGQIQNSFLPPDLIASTAPTQLSLQEDEEDDTLNAPCNGDCSAQVLTGSYAFGTGTVNTTDGTMTVQTALNAPMTVTNGLNVQFFAWTETDGMIVDFSNISATLGGAHVLTVNPYACYANPSSSCYVGAPTAGMTVNSDMLQAAPPAAALSADGISALGVIFNTTSSATVTFTISAPSAVGAFGSLGPFLPNYLSTPTPTAGQTSFPVNPTCDSSGSCTAAALLWSPQTMPVTPSTSSFLPVNLNVTATQGSSTLLQTSIVLEPPPLLLVHGIWSSAAAAWPPFLAWLATNYPHDIIQTVDYGPYSFKAFSDPNVQDQMVGSVSSILANAAGSGMAARTVDVVAHSMGGLVTRYFQTNVPSELAPILPPNPVHKLITIGTPQDGSPFATTLWNNQTATFVTGNPFVFYTLCRALSSCTLGQALSVMGKRIDTGVQLLQTGIPSSSTPYSAMVGETSSFTLTEGMLDAALAAFIPGQTVEGVLGPSNDTIVPAANQSIGAIQMATISGVVHTSLCGSCNTGETASPTIWGQALYWLSGGSGQAPLSSIEFPSQPHPMDSGGSIPILDLTGYTQIASSNVTFAPASGSTLTINSTANITATSSKTITEILLFQTVADPVDIPLLYSTQSPFSISFTPTRMGTANFVAFAVFSDNTFATTTLNYTLQPSGNPSSLTLSNIPQGSLAPGMSVVTHAQAQFSSGSTDVTQVATYSTRSGTSAVFSPGPGGIITANGSGVDTLDVSYGGVSASAQIEVGSCIYSLSTSDQVVNFQGGTESIQVTTAPGCAWTATSNATWLTATHASGSGSGTAIFAANANGTGSALTGFITLAGQTLEVIQPPTACSYGLSQSQISAPAGGLSGSLMVATSCPIVFSSNANWLTASNTGNILNYVIAANSNASSRSGTLTIGNQTVAITQAGAPFGSEESLQQIGGSLTQLSVGADGSVWGINSGEQIYTYSSNSGQWINIPGSLRMIAAGSATAVWGLNDANQIYHLDSANSTWVNVAGELNQIAVGADGSVWGINYLGSIYYYNGSGWTQVKGQLTSISVASAGAVYGLNSDGSVYWYNPGAGSFQWVGDSAGYSQLSVGVDGDLWAVRSDVAYHWDVLHSSFDTTTGASISQVAVGSGAVVFGLDLSGDIFQWDAASQTWAQIPGTLSSIAVGANGTVWGTNSSQQIFLLSGFPTRTYQQPNAVSGSLNQISVGIDGSTWGLSSNTVEYFDSGSQSFQALSGAPPLAQLCVGAGADVWGVDASGNIFQYNAAAGTWANIPGELNLIQVSEGPSPYGSVWGINAAGQIYTYNLSNHSWTNIPGTLQTLSVGVDGTVWGVNAQQQIYRFDAARQSWTNIPGSLVQISVGRANNVWGVNAQQQVYYYDNTSQKWVNIPGAYLTDISVAFDGSVWGVSAAGSLYQWNSSTQTFNLAGSEVNKVFVGNSTTVWALNTTSGAVFSWF